MMASSTAMVLTLGGIALAAAEDSAVKARMHDLMDKGFEVVAEGKLIESVTCTEHTMQVFPARPPEDCFGNIVYGSFKRLKHVDQEFVCVSFRGWDCYQSAELAR